MKAAFIVVEGLEGAGKSSVINAIQAFLETKEHAVITTREPGGTPMAEAIRDCVKHNWENETVTQETELLLMYAARSQLVNNIIKPALNNNTFVVGDRHNLSSVAYQGGGRGIALNVLAQLKEMTLGNFAPDLTLYLDIDPRIGLERARGRGELDRIEQAGMQFFDNARHMYQNQISLLKTKNKNSAFTIDASEDMQTVHDNVLSSLTQWYEQEWS